MKVRSIKAKLYRQVNPATDEQNLVFRSDPLTPNDDHFIQSPGWSDATCLGDVVLVGEEHVVSQLLDCEFRKVLSVL